MLYISAYTRCLVEKVCSLVWSTWGTSQSEDKLGARDKILNTKVARQANIPPWIFIGWIWIPWGGFGFYSAPPPRKGLCDKFGHNSIGRFEFQWGDSSFIAGKIKGKVDAHVLGIFFCQNALTNNEWHKQLL